MGKSLGSLTRMPMLLLQRAAVWRPAAAWPVLINNNLQLVSPATFDSFGPAATFAFPGFRFRSSLTVSAFSLRVPPFPILPAPGSGFRCFLRVPLFLTGSAVFPVPPARRGYLTSLASSVTAWSVFLSIFRMYQLARMTRAGGWASAWERIAWSFGLAAGSPKWPSISAASTTSSS